MEELVSIIVPVYNSQSFLTKCIESILKQKYTNIEVILINDGSTDNSLKIIQEFAQKDQRILIIDQHNKGVSAARNKGIEIAKGKYITFIDADDFISENYLQDMMEQVESNALISNNFYKKYYKEVEKEKYMKDIAIGKIKGVCWGYLFEKDYLKNIKFDSATSYMEDTIFIINYLNIISKIKIIKNNSYYHTVNENGLTQSNIDIDKKIQGYIYSLDKIIDKLKEINYYDKSIERKMNARKVKLIESEFAKCEDIEEIKRVLRTISYKKSLNCNQIPLQYKIFYKIMKSKNSKKMWEYIKFRKKLKGVLKRGKNARICNYKL